MVMAVRCRAELSVKLRLIRTLAQYGFPADVRSPLDSWTPLFAAVELGSLVLVEALVKLGARLSADRHLGFTPLHLACQMGHWHLLPALTAAMQGQYARVAAWGPSPQYVSLNLVDAYGRTALDIALLRYFSESAAECCAGSSSSGCGGRAATSQSTEQQKAVDILREYVHRRSPAKDPGLVCGWEPLRVLRFLDALPGRKAEGKQMWGVDWEGSLLKGDGAAEEAAQGEKLCNSDLEELLQAVRLLVQVGVQTKKLPQDLVQPPTAQRLQGGGAMAEWAASGSGSASSSGNCGGIKEALAAFGGRLRHDRGPKYSPIEPEDAAESSADDGAL